METSFLSGFSFDSYLHSRLFLEWTKALDDYKIAWSDETSAYSREIQISLDDLNIELFLLGPYQTPRSSMMPFSAAEKWADPTYWGDQRGHFGRTGHSEDTGNLHWCETCSKVFLSSLERSVCTICKGEETYLVEAGLLTWFGYPGPVNFHPVPIKRPVEAKPSQPHLQNQVLATEQISALLGAPKAPMVNDLFDEEEAVQAGKRQEGEWENLKKALSGKARVHGWPAQAAVEALAAQYPNFAEICEFVMSEISLAPYRRAELMRLPNILVVGGPSSGKSSFCRRLSKIVVGDDWERVDLGQNPSSFEIVGSDSGYNRAKEGRVIRLMASRDPKGPVLNPVLILDELDKVSATMQFSPLSALLSLLEKRDAERFRDAFFGVPVDASGIQFLATANDRYAIPGPLLSRFEVFTVADYTPDQFIDVVIPNIYSEWIREFHDGTFPESLPQPMRHAIAEEVGFVSRRVIGALVRLSREGSFGFRPAPTWESLKIERGLE